MVDTENDDERGGAAPAADFIGYLDKNDVQLKGGVTPEQFAAESEALAHELARATVASKGIFKTAEIERQFRLIVENASSVRALLDKSPLVREEMQYLTGRQLLKRWIRRKFSDGTERPTEEQRLAVRHEQERIEGILSDYPIEEVMASILEAARFGEQGAAEYGPETPEHRRATIRDQTIANRCADVFEKLTSRRAARTSIDAGDQREQAGPFLAFVSVVCGRISEILDEQGFERLRRRPSDRTLKSVIKARRE
jgi:hypothetical protein